MKKLLWVQVVIALLLIVGVIGLFMVIKAKNTSSGSQALEVTETLNTSLQAETVAALLDDLIIERAEINAQLVTKGKEVKVIELAEVLARDAGVDLTVQDVSFTEASTEAEKKEFIKDEQERKIIEFPYLSMDVVARGAWSDVFTFMHTIESSMRGLSIQHFELESVEQEEGEGFEWVLGLMVNVRAQ